MTEPQMTAERYEQVIAEEAGKIRAGAKSLTPELFMALWPLLCKPIPDQYIVTAPRVTGKPYESTGIKSVQVQIDRMNNVLTPLWWWDAAAYEQNGKLCQVTVYVGVPELMLVSRSSYGGVERGSGLGNVYKGSYTNAAKLAFARVGPGREVYIGMTDLDPDVAGEVEGGEETGQGAGADIAATLFKRADQLGLTDRLQLAASHVVGRDVGACSTEEEATKALSSLTFEQAERLDQWLSKKADERSAA